MAEMLTKMHQLLQLLGRESVIITPALDMCRSKSATTNLSLLRWKALNMLEGKEANSSIISWR